MRPENCFLSQTLIYNKHNNKATVLYCIHIQGHTIKILNTEFKRNSLILVHNNLKKNNTIFINFRFSPKKKYLIS